MGWDLALAGLPRPPPLLASAFDNFAESSAALCCKYSSAPDGVGGAAETEWGGDTVVSTLRRAAGAGAAGLGISRLTSCSSVMPNSSTCSAFISDTKCWIVALNQSSSSSVNMVDIFSGLSTSCSKVIGPPNAFFHPAWTWPLNLGNLQLRSSDRNIKIANAKDSLHFTNSSGLG